MKTTFGFDVGNMGFIFGSKVTDMMAFAIYPYACGEWLRQVVSRDPIHAKQSPIFSWSLPNILGVNLLATRTKVLDTIIHPVAIDMIYQFWPRPGHIKPCKTMRKVGSVDNANGFVPEVQVRASCALSAIPGVPHWASTRAGKHRSRAGKPSENAAVRVVVKKIAQALRCKIKSSHDAVLLQSGQRSRRVAITSRPRYFRLLSRCRQALAGTQ